MKLGIATICPHIYFDGRWWSYEPFVLEMNVWAELFDELVMIAPTNQGLPSTFMAPYRRSTAISLIPYRKNRGYGLEQDPTSIREVPAMISSIIKASLKTDAFHVRSPGSIGLISSLLVPLLKKRACAKYAGQWNGYPDEALTVRLQRAILRSPWWRGPVTVYGRWPNQRRNIIPFFTSVLTADQMARARAQAEKARYPPVAGGPLRVLYVGRLSKAKNIDILLASIARLSAQSIDIESTIIGDGPHLSSLKAQTERLGIEGRVKFVGGLSFEKVLDYYEQADVLVLVSETEGWPKAITEGMAFGLICIGSDQGLIPEILGEGRGLIVPPGDEKALTEALRAVARAPQDYQGMRASASAWSQRYSLEGLREALRELLAAHWGDAFPPCHQTADAQSDAPRL